MIFKWSNFIWLVLYGTSLWLVHRYKPFELNLYTGMIMYKFSEKYIIVLGYLLGIITGGIILVISVFVPEMLGDIYGLIIRTLTGYLRRLNPQLAEQVP